MSLLLCAPLLSGGGGTGRRTRFSAGSQPAWLHLPPVQGPTWGSRSQPCPKRAAYLRRWGSLRNAGLGPGSAAREAAWGETRRGGEDSKRGLRCPGPGFLGPCQRRWGKRPLTLAPVIEIQKQQRENGKSNCIAEPAPGDLWKRHDPHGCCRDHHPSPAPTQALSLHLREGREARGALRCKG